MDTESDSNFESSPTSTSRSIRDTIHEIIYLPELVSAVVDTRQFQRLRNIKQLGTCHYVWPGATHTRFEHCLGVYHLAFKMVTHLAKEQPDLGITERDIRCVSLAGLLHDLGHGPWSHVWDNLFIPKALPDRNWTHEQGSEQMVDYLLADDDSIEITPGEAKFIKALIAGDHARVPDEKLFLFDIVANKRNGIDVDKFDYLMRDSRMLGEAGSISLARIIDSARVIDDQICYHIKDANQISELGQNRFRFHKKIYNHKTTVAIEYMIIDALLLAEPYMHIAERINTPETYLHLHDFIAHEIESSTSPDLAAAQAIFSRIRKRNLYKSVDYKIFAWGLKKFLEDNITPESIAAAWLTCPRPKSNEEQPEDGDAVHDDGLLDPKDIIVCLSPMHYGMKDKNPLDFIMFYNPKSKGGLSRCWKATPEDVTLVQPVSFGEVQMRIYTRTPEHHGKIQAAYRHLMDTLEMPSPTTEPVSSQSTARMSTPPPSTPPAYSKSNNVLGRTGSASFSHNKFTEVPLAYPAESPGNKRSASPVKLRTTSGGVTPAKRRRDDDDDHMNSDAGKNGLGKKRRSG